jgi:type I restriction enzyme S subunit
MQFCDKVSGAVVKNLNSDKVANSVFPLPPIAEQKRIVTKLEEILPLIDRYEAAWNKLEEFNKRFPGDMQKSILQLAIQGKLVEQRPEEGTGEELFQQIQSEKQALIKAGKIKKEKPLPDIAEDEITFDIPDTWKLVRFCEIASFQNGDRSKNYPNRNEYVDNGVAWINTGHITPNGYLDVNSMNYITEEKYHSLSNGHIQEGDLVYCLRGATFGKTARIEPFSRGAIASSLMIIRLHNTALREYVYWYLKSPVAYRELRKYDNGSAQPNLAAKDVAKYLIPLPPLAEQKRIADVLERVLGVVE